MRSRLQVAAWFAIELVLIGLVAWIGLTPPALRAALADPQGWVDQVGPDTAAVAVAGLVCWAMLVWVTLGLLLVATAAAPGAIGRAADAFARCLVPAALRRAATVAFGISVGTAAVTSAATAESRPGQVAHVARPLIGVSQDQGQHHRPSGVASASPGVDWPFEPAPPEPPPNRGSPSTGPSAGQDGGGGSTIPSRGWPGSPEAPATAGGRPTAASSPPPGSRPATGADRAGTPTATTATPLAEPTDAGAEAGSVLVRPGDCLWLIAARRLGPQATAAEIAREWPRWYAMNRQVIGDDPDVIRPGQPLAAPPGPALFPNGRSR
jgi:resuscitation-promoting factor RpfA